MAVVNVVGNSLTGITGSGAFVGNNSPIITSPNIGAAAATSINFGGSTLSTYIESTFNATLTFATPGDLSVAYTSQVNSYTKFGNIVQVRGNMSATPTYTTASGDLRIASIPSILQSTVSGGGKLLDTSAFAYPSGCTFVNPVYIAGTNYLNLVGFGTGVIGSTLGTTQFPSGVAIVVIYFYSILVV